MEYDWSILALALESVFAGGMEEAEKKADILREKIRIAEKDLQNMKSRLASIEAESSRRASALTIKPNSIGANDYQKWPLSPEEYKRYGRQMIVPNVGLKGDYIVIHCLFLSHSCSVSEIPNVLFLKCHIFV